VLQDHLTLHYHLGILIFFDVLDSFERKDLVPKGDSLQSNTVQEVLNVLVVGMQCKLSLGSVFGSSLSADRRQEMVSLLSIDPYPHHVATAMDFVAVYLQKTSGRSRVSSGALDTIRKTLMDAFDHLPQCSASLRAARTGVVEKLTVVAGGQESEHDGSEDTVGTLIVDSEIFRPDEFSCDVDAPRDPVSAADVLINNIQSREIQQNSDAIFDQWNWSSFEDTLLSFEALDPDVFLYDHGLLEVSPSTLPCMR
jgi:hypothetical protein